MFIQHTTLAMSNPEELPNHEIDKDDDSRGGWCIVGGVIRQSQKASRRIKITVGIQKERRQRKLFPSTGS